jgi:hypothetical protein
MSESGWPPPAKLEPFVKLKWRYFYTRAEFNRLIITLPGYSLFIGCSKLQNSDPFLEGINIS